LISRNILDLCFENGQSRRGLSLKPFWLSQKGLITVFSFGKLGNGFVKPINGKIFKNQNGGFFGSSNAVFNVAP